LVEVGDVVLRFDGGAKGREESNNTTFDSRVKDMSKVTLMPLLIVAFLSDASIPLSVGSK